MNNTNKRQIIEEIYFLGRSKQHSSIFVLGLKGSFKINNLDKILNDKRRAYNYSYVNSRFHSVGKKVVKIALN